MFPSGALKVSIAGLPDEAKQRVGDNASTAEDGSTILIELLGIRLDVTDVPLQRIDSPGRKMTKQTFCYRSFPSCSKTHFVHNRTAVQTNE